VIGNHHPAGSTVTVTEPAAEMTRDGFAARIAAADEDLAESILPACVGPIAIPPGQLHTLRSLARSTAADDFAALMICATVLAGRLPRADTPRRVHLTYGFREAATPPQAEAPDLGISFRAALGLAARYQTAVPGPTQWPADVTLLVSEDGCRLFGESKTNPADAPSTLCWTRTFLYLLNCLVARPDVPMDTHSLIDDDERHRILETLNAYHDPVVAHRTMAAPFEEQVERTPDAVALVDEDGDVLSYRELNERANRLAHFLLNAGAGPGGRVGLCLSRSTSQIVAIYAAVKAGVGYVPLDTELPDARLAYMLQDCAPTHVLTDPISRNRIPDGPWSVHDVQADRASWHACSATNPAVETNPAALLHILYTSGSTGRPKGVAYPTNGALAQLAWMQSRYPFGEGDTALFKTSPGFDVSIWEIFWPLYHGARLLICRPGGHRDPRHLAELVQAHAITTIFLPPTIMTPFLTNVSSGRARALRWVLCGGEPVTPRIRDSFHATLPATTLVNCYGPTEAGSVTDMGLAPEFGVPVVPLGRPAEHFRLAVLDENLQPTPVGMPGEAYLGGRIGLAHGYWRAAGHTAERFVADPYGPPGTRTYRTGDLCRYRDDGVLEHLGRIDRQIKLRGVRVEPGEIESVLVTHPAVADCAVVAHGHPVRLIAFVVPADPTSDDGLDVDAVLQHAAAVLPDNIRPDRIVPVACIPATVNGKIDTETLLASWPQPGERERDIVPPEDDLEEELIGIYSRVLETTPVSVLDSFTELGGHSIQAFQLLDRCQEQLQLKPAVTVLLTGTVRDVAVSIRATMAETGGGPEEPES